MVNMHFMHCNAFQYMRIMSYEMKLTQGDEPMNILEKLNSGALHARSRLDRPDCVDAKGSIHASPERAAFVNWRTATVNSHGDVSGWSAELKAEYAAKHVGIAQ
jgi:hypothetical protein